MPTSLAVLSGERLGWPWLAQPMGATSQTTWFAQAVSIDLGDRPSDQARPEWFHRFQAISPMTWLALGGSIHPGDMPNDLARPRWLD